MQILFRKKSIKLYVMKNTLVEKHFDETLLIIDKPLKHMTVRSAVYAFIVIF